jgi:hypothetical protein
LHQNSELVPILTGDDVWNDGSQAGAPKAIQSPTQRPRRAQRWV